VTLSTGSRAYGWLCPRNAAAKMVIVPDPVRVIVVDDHPIARRGVEGVLAQAGDFEVVASADSVAELTRHAVDAADVVILDLYHDGDEPCLAAVAEVSARTRVLVMSASARPQDVLGAMRAGASGYITKRTQPALFATAVQTVATGGFWMSSQLADIMQARLTEPARPAAPDPRPQLSPREEQALDLIARGYTHAQAANRMGVTKATVDTYVERIRAKLQVGNKAELTRAALQRPT
jgi:two-component system, NarL family, nitrate/nitrite response regulator NarL